MRVARCTDGAPGSFRVRLALCAARDRGEEPERLISVNARQSHKLCIEVKGDEHVHDRIEGGHAAMVQTCRVRTGAICLIDLGLETREHIREREETWSRSCRCLYIE